VKIAGQQAFIPLHFGRTVNAQIQRIAPARNPSRSRPRNGTSAAYPITVNARNRHAGPVQFIMAGSSTRRAARGWDILLAGWRHPGLSTRPVAGRTF